MSDKKLCNVVGCGKPTHAQSFCWTHYRKYKKIGLLQPVVRQPLNRKCTAPDCNEKHFAHGFCHKHYEKHKLDTDPVYKAKKMADRKKKYARQRNDPIYLAKRKAYMKEYQQQHSHPRTDEMVEREAIAHKKYAQKVLAEKMSALNYNPETMKAMLTGENVDKRLEELRAEQVASDALLLFDKMLESIDAPRPTFTQNGPFTFTEAPTPAKEEPENFFNGDEWSYAKKLALADKQYKRRVQREKDKLEANLTQMWLFRIGNRIQSEISEVEKLKDMREAHRIERWLLHVAVSLQGDNSSPEKEGSSASAAQASSTSSAEPQPTQQ
jgi:hypothetical protein